MRRVQWSQRWLRAIAAAFALTALTAVIAMAARAPLSRTTPVDARSARAPVTALLVLVMGAGIVGLAALVLVVWPGRRRSDDDDLERPERPQIPWIWKLLALVSPFALGAALMVAAVVGLKTTNGTSASPSHAQVAPSTTSPRHPPAGSGFSVPTWLPWTVLGIAAGAVGVGGWLLSRRWRGPIETASPEATMTAAVQAGVAALENSVDEPRQAVIAAYTAMQQALAAHGVARSPAEAPREFLKRVLIASSATEQEARTLTGLFEEARFSTHPISERVRELALSSLSLLRARLQTGIVR